MNIETFSIAHNVNQKEIDKFEVIASNLWDIEGDLKLLHRINPLRLDYIAQYSDGLFNKKVLDVGCGVGILAESMAREGAIVTGIDVGFELLKIARAHAIESDLNISYVQETIEEHAEKYACKYDIITCMEVLEHVPNPQSIIKSCAQLVKSDNGKVFFSTINRNIKAWLIAIIGAEYILGLIPKGMHNLKKFIKPAELLSWIDKTSLKGQHIIGLHYNPLIDKFRFGTCVDINYILYTDTINN